MTIRPYTTEAELAPLRALYEAAFPASEKKPFSLILEKRDEGFCELLGIEEAGHFVGLAIFVLTDTLALLDYFAILPEARGRGVGTRALAHLRTRYAGRAFLLEVEAPDEAGADNRAERVRRLSFYLRNGLSKMPYRVSLFGVEMHILTDGTEVSFDAYHGIFRRVFPRAVGRVLRLE